MLILCSGKFLMNRKITTPSAMPSINPVNAANRGIIMSELNAINVPMLNPGVCTLAIHEVLTSRSTTKPPKE